MYLIIGLGQLGSELFKFYPNSAALTHEQIKVEHIESVVEALRELKPTVVFNTAAFHNVALCEDYPEKAYQVNSIGARNLAIACKEIGAKLVHFSTDYVFDGRKGAAYFEIDVPNPIQVYGNSKLAGEYYVLQNDGIVVRVSALFGKFKCRAKQFNFPQMMIQKAKTGELNVVDDEVVTPTYTYNLVLQLDKLLKYGYQGLVHCTNKNPVSWFDFAKLVLKTAKIDQIVNPIKSTGNLRPKYSALMSNAIREIGLDCMWDIERAVDHYIHY